MFRLSNWSTKTNAPGSTFDRVHVSQQESIPICNLSSGCSSWSLYAFDDTGEWSKFVGRHQWPPAGFGGRAVPNIESCAIWQWLCGQHLVRHIPHLAIHRRATLLGLLPFVAHRDHSSLLLQVHPLDSHHRHCVHLRWHLHPQHASVLPGDRSTASEWHHNHRQPQRLGQQHRGEVGEY